jgi:hypothetical protein
MTMHIENNQDFWAFTSAFSPRSLFQMTNACRRARITHNPVNCGRYVVEPVKGGYRVYRKHQTQRSFVGIAKLTRGKLSFGK